MAILSVNYRMETPLKEKRVNLKWYSSYFSTYQKKKKTPPAYFPFENRLDFEFHRLNTVAERHKIISLL